MPTTYVAIDVETTGLDPNKDAIIEVAAITFRENDILDEFTSLVNPGKSIPPYITQLTGINDEMVEDAPSMFTVRSRLRPVLAEHVLVGHNVGFDLGFLRAERLGIGNQPIDTLPLAMILVPDAGRYNLETLVRHLKLPGAEDDQTHRAYDDASQTVELFLALRERALALAVEQLEEITLAGQRLAWSEMLFFQEVLAEKAKNAFTTGDGRRKKGLAPLYTAPKLIGHSLTPVEKLKKLDTSLVAKMIQPGGNFSRLFPGFEHRPQQVEMLRAVCQAFNKASQILIEAGTGTGKSVGYLLPAAFWANENGRRVVISTNTINLQDQLVQKDIPALQHILPFELRASVRKGRSNYVCTRLFQQMRHSGPTNSDEMVMFARILLWLPKTESGDMAELSLRSPGERQAWAKLNAENATCTSDLCAQENCPLHIAKRKAEQAHIVIVNHALLLSDVANEGHILPEFKDLIVDEAHHLETAVTDGLSFRADKRSLETILEEITKPRAGLIADLQNRLQSALPPQLLDKANELVNRMRAEAQQAAIRLDEFFTTLDYFLQEFVNKRSQFAEQIRFTRAIREHGQFDELVLSWDNLGKHLGAIATGLVKLAAGLEEVVGDLEDGEDLRLTIASNGRSLEETRANLESIIAKPSEQMIYWVEVFKGNVSLHAAPLHVGPLVEQHIFRAKETVILTSATMQTAVAGNAASFAYIKNRLHAHESDELAVGSPFDYKSTTLLFLASDIPEPNQPGYQRMVEQAIVDVAQALGGRTMVLFTAYGQLQQTARAIEEPLGKAGITTLAQMEGASRQQLLEQFKRPDSRAVLLGTRSFWEGVDVPGEALQALVIVKLPFDVPSDPIFAARSETFEDSFFQYSVPEAVLRFRQGFGRLIRRQSDEGVVVVLDKRVLTKRYGQLFLEALPECTVLRQRIGRLGELTVRWLRRERPSA